MTSENFRKLKRQDGFTTALAFLFLTLLIIVCPFNTKSAMAAAAGGGGGRNGIGLGIGQILLMGDFAKDFDNGLGFDLMYDHEASPMFGLLVQATMSNHSDATGTNSLSIKGLTPDLRINLAYLDKLVVYSFTGFGLFMANETVGSQSGSVMTLGFNLGSGVSLALSQHFRFGTSLAFWNVFGRTDSSTVTASNPTGLSIGGTYFGLFLSAMYYF